MTRINLKYNFSGTADVIRDIDFTFFEQKEKTRLNKIAKREEIRNRLLKVIYPCNSFGWDKAASTINYDEP